MNTISNLREILLNPRLIGVLSALLFLYYFYDAAYIQERRSTNAPYPVLLFWSLFGSFIGVYLIEKYENKWQLYTGYLCLYTFLIVAIGGVFFDL